VSKKRFTVVDGPDKGMTFPLDEGQSYVIGREQAHEAGLTDTQAAAEHCEVRMSDGTVTIRDLGSSGGTLCNGQPVTESELADGDLIVLGATKIKVEPYVASGETIGLADRSELEAQIQEYRAQKDKSGKQASTAAPAEKGGSDAASSPAGGWEIVVDQGPDQGTRRTLKAGESLSVGRGQDADFRLSDPRISRKHCVIDALEGVARIAHSGGSGGTMVNSQSVDTRDLKSGDTIQIGDSTLRVSIGGSNESTLPPKAVGGAAAAADSDSGYFDLIGQTINDYRVDRELASGNSGVIFKCTHTETNRDVALKVLRPEIAKDEEEMQRFVRAMKTMQPIRHENLVRIYTAGRTSPHVWIALEYVDGESVAQVIERIGTVGMLEWTYAFRVAVQIARGLEAAYAHQIIHRNITPDNILIRSSDKVAKLGDMMLAKALEGNKAEQITRPGQLIGDMAYSPPERTGVKGDVDCRSDIYALGATVYALVAGRPPFESTSLPELLTMIRTQEPESPKVFQLAVNDMFAGVVMRMLEKRPEDRYHSPTELLTDLERVGKFAGVSV